MAELLHTRGCPIERMAGLAMNDQHNPRLRGRMYSGLAPYVYPKTSRSGSDGEHGGPAMMRIAETIRAHREARVREIG